MNEDQFKGTARNLGGKVEDEVGKLVNDPELRGDGVINQVTGAAQNMYGDAKEFAKTAYEQASPAVRAGADRAISMTRENSVLAVLAAGAIGYAIAWAMHSSSKNSTNHGH